MTRDDRLIYQLFMAQQKLRTYIQNVLVAEGVRITLVQAGILFLLELKDGKTMGELTDGLGLDKSTLTGLVDRLERAGFVRREPGETDRRVFRIFITPKGEEESRKAQPIIGRVNREMKSGFSRKEIETFKRILNGLLHRFNKARAMPLSHGPVAGGPPQPDFRAGPG